MSKIKIEDIKTALESENWKLISDSYVNLDTEMKFECPNGHNVFAKWRTMRNRLVCPTCKHLSFVAGNQEIQAKKPGKRRVLALDQASHISGYAIFDDTELVSYGHFETNSREEVERFNQIKNWLLSLLFSWKPDHVAIEGIQFQEENAGGKHMGITVFQTLARLQGILMDACYQSGVNFEICPTNTWRHACGVKGKTRVDKKRSMQLLVKNWYGINVSDDEADAIGIGHYLTQIIHRNNQVENWEV